MESTMAKQNSPGFLAIVNDARSRVRKCTVQDVKAKQDRGDRFVLVAGRFKTAEALVKPN